MAAALPLGLRRFRGGGREPGTRGQARGARGGGGRARRGGLPRVAELAVPRVDHARLPRPRMRRGGARGRGGGLLGALVHPFGARRRPRAGRGRAPRPRVDRAPYDRGLVRRPDRLPPRSVPRGWPGRRRGVPVGMCGDRWDRPAWENSACHFFPRCGCGWEKGDRHFFPTPRTEGRRAGAGSPGGRWKGGAPCAIGNSVRPASR